ARHVAERVVRELHIHDDRGRPLIALSEPGVKGADLQRLEAGTPAKGVDGVAARGQQVAAAALARPDPAPPAVPGGDVGEILRPGEPNRSQPTVAAEPVRELQERVVSEPE